MFPFATPEQQDTPIHPAGRTATAIACPVHGHRRVKRPIASEANHHASLPTPTPCCLVRRDAASSGLPT